jgi:hypothetical protein
MEDFKSALADYIVVLDTSAAKTPRAEDRGRYQQHLAAAALMYAALVKNRSIDKLKALVASERQSFGRDFLDGPEGKSAEAAFNAFANLVEVKGGR